VPSRHRGEASCCACCACWGAPASLPPDDVTMLQPHRHPIGRRLYLIDAKAQVYRLSHGYGDAATAPPPAPQAGPGSGSGGGSGEESSLVAHGFVNILLSLFNHKPPPTHMAVVVDAPGATFRHAWAWKVDKGECLGSAGGGGRARVHFTIFGAKQNILDCMRAACGCRWRAVAAAVFGAQRRPFPSFFLRFNWPRPHGWSCLRCLPHPAPRPPRRSVLFPQYKAQRSAAPQGEGGRRNAPRQRHEAGACAAWPPRGAPCSMQDGWLWWGAAGSPY
jgi:hypothetical protein